MTACPRVREGLLKGVHTGQVLLKGGECGPRPEHPPRGHCPHSAGQSLVGGAHEGRPGPRQGRERFSQLAWALSSSPGFWEQEVMGQRAGEGSSGSRTGAKKGAAVQGGRVRDASEGTATGHGDRLGTGSEGREGPGMTGAGALSPPPSPQPPTGLRLFCPYGLLQ